VQSNLQTPPGYPNAYNEEPGPLPYIGQPGHPGPIPPPPPGPEVIPGPVAPTPAPVSGPPPGPAPAGPPLPAEAASVPAGGGQ
jgi:phospholipid/cholesterol/gamma-HCH transport system substrate-binding protein